MTLTIARGRRYAGLASLVAPAVVLVLAKVAGLGPLASRGTPIDSADEGEAAAPTDRLPPPVLEPSLRLSSDPSVSQARSRLLREQPATSLASPFYRRPAIEETPVAAASPPPQAAPAPPAFVLSGVMNGRPPVAVIDDNVHRPGDDLGDGWSVESIDARNLIVTLRHADGRVHRLNAVQR